MNNKLFFSFYSRSFFSHNPSDIKKSFEFFFGFRLQKGTQLSILTIRNFSYFHIVFFCVERNYSECSQSFFFLGIQFFNTTPSLHFVFHTRFCANSTSLLSRTLFTNIELSIVRLNLITCFSVMHESLNGCKR